MRDLKHLIYFENLLQQANNDLVQDACKDGRLALAWNCSYIPEVLLDTDKCFGVRLRAPNCTNPDMATYYMTNRSCPYSKSILERAFEGGYNFISALIGQECCTTMNRMEQYFEYCELIPNEKFFCTYLDMPLRKTEWHAGYYRRQIEQKIIQPLEKVYGVDFSEDNLRRAVEQFNEVCRIMTEINAMREAENPVITGYEFHVIQLCTQTCPKDLILPYLRETLAEIRTREADAQKNYRVRVAVVGSEIDDPDLIRLIESCGALVVADRYCYGSFPGRQEIVLTDGEDALTQVCRWYLQHTECPRQSALHRVQYRNDHVAQLVHDFKADGAIYEQMKFCTYWSYERVIANQIMPRDYGIHILSIDRPYIAGQSGQLRTRVQAFVESLEMKQLRSAQKEDN